MDKISLQDLLDKANQQTKSFIKNLEEEEKNIERVETIDLVRNEILSTRKNTEHKKKLFINELKSGLGVQIKNNPNEIKINKKTFKQKLKEFFKKIFKRF